MLKPTHDRKVQRETYSHNSAVSANHGQSFSSYSSACSGNSKPDTCFSGSKNSAPIRFSEEPSQAMIQATRACMLVAI